MSTHADRRPRRLRTLAAYPEATTRARVRHDFRLAQAINRELWDHRRTPTYAEVAATLNARGLRLWRGFPLTAANVGRLARRWRACSPLGPMVHRDDPRARHLDGLVR